VGFDYANPKTRTRVALALLFMGGAIAGLGSLIRDLAEEGTAQWTFLLDTIGLVIAIAGGIQDFRAQLMVGDFNPRATKRRGAIVLLLGVLAAGGGCWLLGWRITGQSQPVLQLILSAIMTIGFGAVIDGILHIGWFGSGDYLDRRIAQRADEEW
jgi:hypothetical protein